MRTILERRDMDAAGERDDRGLAGLAQLLALGLDGRHGRDRLHDLGGLALARVLLAQRGGGLVDQLAQLLELVALADAARADLLAADHRLQVLLEAVDR